MRETKMPEWLRFVILFGIEFNVTVYKFITLRKIVFLFLLYIFIKNWNHEKRSNLSKSWVALILSFAFLVIYGVILNYVNQVGTNISASIYPAKTPVMYLLYILIFPYLLSLIFTNFKDFSRIQSNVMLFQALVVITGKFNKQFALFICENFNYDFDGRIRDGIMRGVRIPCIDVAGATASVVLVMGCICCLYLMNTEKNKTVQLIKYLFIMSSMLFVGRTGLYTAIIILVWYFFFSMINKQKITVYILGIGTTALLGISMYIIFAPDSTMKVHYMNWVGEIITKGIGEGSTIRAISDMVIPPLTKETFWGMSIVRGTSRLGTVVQHDSGYVMNYASLGLFGAIILYGSIFSFYCNQLRYVKEKWSKLIIICAFVCCIVFEFKEPFLRKTPLLIILSIMVFLGSNRMNSSAKNIKMRSDT